MNTIIESRAGKMQELQLNRGIRYWQEGPSNTDHPLPLTEAHQKGHGSEVDSKKSQQTLQYRMPMSQEEVQPERFLMHDLLFLPQS